jgi:hypothetical protein
MLTINRKVLAACMMGVIGALVIGAAYADGEQAVDTAQTGHGGRLSTVATRREQ